MTRSLPDYLQCSPRQLLHRYRLRGHRNQEKQNPQYRIPRALTSRKHSGT